MNFAENSIGFLLQLDDQLTPALASAEKSYYSFVKSLDKFNRQAFKSVNKSMGALAELVESFDELPSRAVSAYKSATTQLRKMLAPLKQAITLEFTTKGTKSLAAAVGKAVAQAVSQMSLRMSATVPTRRARGFQTGKSFRAGYANMFQPPDFTGQFKNIPKFAEGGEVMPGGNVGRRKDVDDVLALLSKGEIVIPSDTAEALKYALQKGGFEAEDMVVGFEKAAKLMGKVRPLLGEMKEQQLQNFETWLDEVMPDIRKLNEELKIQETMLADAAKGYKQSAKGLGKFDDALEDTVEEVEAAETAIGRFFQKALGPVRFLAIQNSMMMLGGAFRDLQYGATNAFDELAGGMAPIESLNKNFNDANKKFNVTRDALSALKAEGFDTALKFNVTDESVGAVFESFAELGTTLDFARERMGQAARMAKALGISEQEAASAVYTMGNALKLSETQTEDMIANMRRLETSGAMTGAELVASFEESKKSLVAMQSVLKLSPEASAAYITDTQRMMSAMKTTWGEGADTIQQLMQDALVHGESSEASVALTKMGVTYQELTNMVKEGRVGDALGEISKEMQKFAGQDSGKIAEYFGGGMTPEAVAQMQAGPMKAVENLEAFRKQVVKTGTGADENAAAVKNMMSGYEALKVSMGNWLKSNINQGVMEFFDDFNLQAAFAATHLAKMGIEFLSAAAKATVFRKASGKMTIASKVPAVKGLDSLSTATRGVNPGAGAATGGLLQGVANGLMAFANPKVAIGTGVVVAAIGALAVSLAFAAWLAEKPIQILVSSIERMFTAFIKLDPSHMLAVSASIALLGPSLSMLGGGIAVFANALLLAVPALALLAGINYALGGLDTGLSGMVMGLVETFQVDQTKVDAALKAVFAMAAFMTGFTALLATTAFAKTLNSMDRASPIDGLATVVTWFGGKNMSRNAQLVAQSKDMVILVDRLADSFSDVNGSMRDKLAKVNPVFAALADFMGSYAKIALSLSALKGGAYLEVGATILSKLYGQNSPIETLAEQADAMRGTITELAKGFGAMDVKNLPDVNKVLDVLATFVEKMATVVNTVKGMQTDVFTGAVEQFTVMLGMKSPLALLAKNAKDIGLVVTQVSYGFASVGEEVTQELMDKAGLGITRAAAMLTMFKPLLDQAGVMGDMTDGLNDDFVDKITMLFGGEGGKLTELRKAIYGDSTAEPGGIIDFIGDVATAMKNTESWNGLGAGNLAATARQATGMVSVFDSLTKLVPGVNALAAQTITPESYKLAGANIGYALSMLNTAAFKILNSMNGVKGWDKVTGSDLDAITAYLDKVQGVYTRIAGITVSAAGVDTTKIASLMQDMQMPMPTKMDIERAIMVKLDPATTDKPVLAATQETNELLRQLIAAQAGNGAPARRPVPARSGPGKGASEGTRRMAEGD